MANDTIILVTRDAGLRSSLAAGLGMAGLTLKTVDSCDSPRAGEQLRRAAVLILDDDLGSETRAAWIARLHQRSQAARVILLADGSAADVPPEVACITKRHAARSILALMQLWNRSTEERAEP